MHYDVDFERIADTPVRHTTASSLAEPCSTMRPPGARLALAQLVNQAIASS